MVGKEAVTFLWRGGNPQTPPHHPTPPFSDAYLPLLGIGPRPFSLRRRFSPLLVLSEVLHCLSFTLNFWRPWSVPPPAFSAFFSELSQLFVRPTFSESPNDFSSEGSFSVVTVLHQLQIPTPPSMWICLNLKRTLLIFSLSPPLLRALPLSVPGRQSSH